MQTEGRNSGQGQLPFLRTISANSESPDVVKHLKRGVFPQVREPDCRRTGHLSDEESNRSGGTGEEKRHGPPDLSPEARGETVLLSYCESVGVCGFFIIFLIRNGRLPLVMPDFAAGIHMDHTDAGDRSFGVVRNLVVPG